MTCLEKRRIPLADRAKRSNEAESSTYTASHLPSCLAWHHLRLPFCRQQQQKGADCRRDTNSLTKSVPACSTLCMNLMGTSTDLPTARGRPRSVHLPRAAHCLLLDFMDLNRCWATAHPRDVFPEPEGPHISVTWPLRTPPTLVDFSAPASEKAPESSLSKLSRPVDRYFDVTDSRSSKACAADMVGRRSVPPH